MNHFSKKLITLSLAGVLAAGIFAGCGSSDSDTENSSSDAASVSTSESEETVTITVGASVTPHSEILEQAKPILAEEGIDLEIIQMEDTVTPNTGLVEGSLDANFFQHQPFLDDFNEENGTDLVSIGAVHYEPFGIYAGQTTSLDELPDGATVAVPNNTTNEARALLLLEQEGLITLSEDAGINATINDIVDNPKNLQIVEIAPEQLVSSLPDVDIAIINGNYALEGGLSVSDALATESDEGVAAQTYKNIVVVRKEDEDNEALLKLVEVLQSEEIQTYIEETYNGSVVPIQ